MNIQFQASAVAEAGQHYRETFGHEPKELSEASVANELRAQISKHMDPVTQALAALRARQLPGAEPLDVALSEMGAIREGGDETAILTFNAAHHSIRDAIKRSADLARVLDDDGVRQISSAREALSQLQRLQQEPDLPAGVAEAGALLADLLNKETFFRELAAIAAAAKAIHDAQSSLRGDVLERRTEVYRDALDALHAVPGWDGLDRSLKEHIAAPLEACASAHGASENLSELRTEIEACAGRRDQAIRRVFEAVEGERLATLSVGQFFVGGIETEEQLDQALAGLRDELSRLIGEGKKVIVR